MKLVIFKNVLLMKEIVLSLMNDIVIKDVLDNEQEMELVKKLVLLVRNVKQILVIVMCKLNVLKVVHMQ